jgi:hypothetical protein
MTSCFLNNFSNRWDLRSQVNYYLVEPHSVLSLRNLRNLWMA